MLNLFKSNRGFTLIELLVVILIIAILIAVAAPSFLGQQDKARDSATKQSLTVSRKEVKAAYVSAEDQKLPVSAANPVTDSSGAQALVDDLNQGEPQYEFVAVPNPATTTNISVERISDTSVSLCQKSESQIFFCMLTDELGTLSASHQSDLVAYAADSSVRKSTGTTEPAARLALGLPGESQPADTTTAKSGWEAPVKKAAANSGGGQTGQTFGLDVPAVFNVADSYEISIPFTLPSGANIADAQVCFDGQFMNFDGTPGYNAHNACIPLSAVAQGNNIVFTNNFTDYSLVDISLKYQGVESSKIKVTFNSTPSTTPTLGSTAPAEQLDASFVDFTYDKTTTHIEYNYILTNLDTGESQEFTEQTETNPNSGSSSTGGYGFISGAQFGYDHSGADYRWSFRTSPGTVDYKVVLKIRALQKRNGAVVQASAWTMPQTIVVPL